MFKYLYYEETLFWEYWELRSKVQNGQEKGEVIGGEICLEENELR